MLDGTAYLILIERHQTIEGVAHKGKLEIAACARRQPGIVQGFEILVNLHVMCILIISMIGMSHQSDLDGCAGYLGDRDINELLLIKNKILDRDVVAITKYIPATFNYRFEHLQELTRPDLAVRVSNITVYACIFLLSLIFSDIATGTVDG